MAHFTGSPKFKGKYLKNLDLNFSLFPFLRKNVGALDHEEGWVQYYYSPYEDEPEGEYHQN